jgi:hypothetical protein
VRNDFVDRAEGPETLKEIVTAARQNARRARRGQITPPGMTNSG